MKTQIIEVTNSVEKKIFINFPWKIYKKDSSWVPPLKLALKDMLSPKHPVYKTSKIKLWLAAKDGDLRQVQGRIAAVINDAHNDYHNDKCGFFGFFECIDDNDVSSALFKTAEDYLKSNGLKTIRGPVSPTTNYECGLLIDGFNDSPQLMMTHNPPYYQSLIEDLDYTKTMDLLAYRIIFEKFQMPRVITKISARAEKANNITYRNINLKKWDQEVDLMFDIYNSAWEKNWGFVPMPKEEFKSMTSEMKTILNKKLVIFVEINGETAGVIGAIPDFNQVFKHIPNGKLLPTGIFKLLRGKSYINRFRVIIMGIKKEYRSKGLDSLLYSKIYETAIEEKFKEVEMSWILENNKNMNRPLERMGAEIYKRYRIFEKPLVTKQ